MLSIKKLEEVIGLILILGTLLSAAFVIVGGSLYLIQYGQENIQIEFLQANQYTLDLSQTFYNAAQFSPIAIIELGLLLLVSIQLIRVALLLIYYLVMTDYYFVLISFFILLILLYSFSRLFARAIVS